MNPLSSLIIFNLLLLVFFLVTLFKYKRVCISTFSSFWLLFTGLLSLGYFCASNGYIRNYSNITLSPLIYIFICYIITCIPLIKYDNNNIEFTLSDNQKKVINIFTSFIILISIEPFIENLFKLPQALTDNNLASKMYDMKLNGNADDYLSFIGRKLFRISTTFELLYPILLFYYLSKKVILKKYILGLVIVIFSFWIHELALGGRSSLVQNMFYIVAVYFIMYKYIDKKVNYIIIKYGLILIGMGISFVMLVTISRFNNMSDDNMTFWLWLGLYAGEGILNFSSLLWGITGSTNGNSTFVLLLDILGISENIQVKDLWAMSAKLGVPGNIFYTYIGSFYKDFNIYTVLIIGLLSIITTRFTNVKKNMSLFQILLLCMCARIIMVPTFYTFSTHMSQINAIFSILFTWYLITKK